MICLRSAVARLSERITVAESDDSTSLVTKAPTRFNRGRKIAESDEPYGRSACSMVIFLDWSMPIVVCPEKQNLSTHRIDFRRSSHSYPPQVRMPISPSKFPTSKHIAASMYNASCVLGRYVGRMAASTFWEVE
jgi:hypothetical protein